MGDKENHFTMDRAGPSAGTHRNSGSAVYVLGAQGTILFKLLAGLFTGLFSDERKCLISARFMLQVTVYKTNSNGGTKNDLEVREDWRQGEQLGGWEVPNTTQQDGIRNPGEAELVTLSIDGMLRQGFYSKEKKRAFHIHARLLAVMVSLVSNTCYSKTTLKS